MILYTVFYYIPSLPKKTVETIKTQTQEFVSKNLKSIIGPIVKDITKDLVKDVNIGGNQQLLEKIKTK